MLDTVVGYDVVLANGTQLTNLTASQDPDLFWVSFPPLSERATYADDVPPGSQRCRPKLWHCDTLLLHNIACTRKRCQLPLLLHRWLALLIPGGCSLLGVPSLRSVLCTS